MNKKIIVLCVLVITMFLMPVGLAESEPITQFTFMDTITWDSTPEDVESVLGDGVQRTEQTDESIGTFVVQQTENESFAGYKCGRMVFMYYNSKLYCIACYYTEADVGDPIALIDGLTEIYGAPKVYLPNQTSLDAFVSGNKTLCDWKIGDDTMIEVMKCNDPNSIFPQLEESPYLCFASFENKLVDKQVQAAVQAWSAGSEIEPEK